MARNLLIKIVKMKNNFVNTDQEHLMRNALDVYIKQHRAISKNIANATDPDYKRVKTDFSHLLKRTESTSAVKTTSEKHIPSMEIVRSNSSDCSEEDEAVDYTREMTEMAANQIKYEFVTRALNKYFKGLMTSIVGRFG